jgi:hypothetical protein
MLYWACTLAAICGMCGQISISIYMHLQYVHMVGVVYELNTREFMFFRVNTIPI